MKLSREGAPRRRRQVRRFSGHERAVTIFARQMATMLAAGLPVLRALETLIRQERSRHFEGVLRNLADQVRRGLSLSDALGSFPALFDHLLVNMVRAGEAAGDLPSVLERVADFREKRAQTRGKVRAAMAYPVVVMAVAIIIVGLLMSFVIPQFQNIFDGMLRGQPLPPLTLFVMQFSSLVESRFVELIALVGVVMATVRFGFGRGPGRRLWDRVTFTAPGSRAVVQRAALARFARTLGALVRAGVPILDALQITRDVVGNALVRGALAEVRDRVRDGHGIAPALQATSVFPAIVPSMIAVGEETGRLAEMCDRLADSYEDELERIVAGLTSVIEPIMIVVLALVVGTVVIALFLPIVSIVQNLGLR